ncbi:hypothetical protein L9G74_06690 [Shewanella sp. C32]|uniref:Uncharacterized protein n=1 Tax=Shewanella electrica TaxID=515560 RepID=A0ABT2FIF8_9GAMM|nr:hypothetical protein [Shewanella electrica]MCH1924216.1 hypothetical protein [Shewanella electrica]MCS4556119.1 hypothetical protein [Shewanella electrica]
MNKEINSGLIHAYHKRTHTPLRKAKEILNGMDMVLFDRVLRAMDEQPDPREPFYDPIEDDSETKTIIAQAKDDARSKVKDKHGLGRGSCHLIWREAAEILKEKHNITWFSPAKMNPLVSYD